MSTLIETTVTTTAAYAQLSHLGEPPTMKVHAHGQRSARKVLAVLDVQLEAPVPRNQSQQTVCESHVLAFECAFASARSAVQCPPSAARHYEIGDLQVDLEQVGSEVNIRVRGPAGRTDWKGVVLVVTAAFGHDTPHREQHTRQLTLDEWNESNWCYAGSCSFPIPFTTACHTSFGIELGSDPSAEVGWR